jgi:hypothetical protein
MRPPTRPGPTGAEADMGGEGVHRRRTLCADGGDGLGRLSHGRASKQSRLARLHSAPSACEASPSSSLHLRDFSRHIRVRASALAEEGGASDLSPIGPPVRRQARSAQRGEADTGQGVDHPMKAEARPTFSCTFPRRDGRGTLDQSSIGPLRFARTLNTWTAQPLQRGCLARP